MILAVVPAAGQSRRMGQPKLLLPLGGRSVLEWTLTGLRQGGVEEILVVVGPGVGQLVPVAEATGSQVLRLSEETDDMRATIEHGLQWLEERFRPGSDAAWFLQPADHPLLEPAVVQTLLQTRLEHPDRSVFVPTWSGQWGHPVLIGWAHVAGLRELPAGLGLNAYLRQQISQTLLVPVASATILCDLDTPEDFEKLQQNFPFREGTERD